MIIGTRCTVCHGDVERGDHVICEECGRRLHERCAEYEMKFECPRCADEPWIGAVEL
jgi:predicted amidophosphoribosyltransferase